MKILLIGNYENDQQQSMQRFAKMLEDGLMKMGHEVMLIKPPIVFGKIKKSAHGIGKWLGYIDKFFVFPWIIKQFYKNFDVVHICDHSNAFYLKYIQNSPHLLTCNDLIAIRSALGEFNVQPKWTGRIYQKIILNGINKAKNVACISEATRNDLLRISTLTSDKVSVIYMGLNYPYSPMPKSEALNYLKNHGITKQSFFLHVGGNQFYKNRLGVLKIFNSILAQNSNYYLVMAGKPFTQEMREFIERHNLANKVIEIQGCSNEALRALYSTAEALIFPSLYEGFGWPIIEAQACGCLVFTTNKAPMTEVGGDAAVYINPDNCEQSAQTILHNLMQKDTFIEKAYLNVDKFQTRKMIDLYCSEYSKLLQDA